MKKYIAASVFFLSAVLATAIVSSAAVYDLTGSWMYSTFGHRAAGMCPAGSPTAGTAVIEQAGDAFTLRLTSGSVCRPASMCVFSGTVTGAVYSGSNSDTVDDEGGRVTNELVFTADSPKIAGGTVSATYVIDDFSCSWSYSIRLTREETTGGDTSSDEAAGPGTDAL